VFIFPVPDVSLCPKKILDKQISTDSKLMRNHSRVLLSPLAQIERIFIVLYPLGY
jgi:hypothetical protein